MMKFVPAFLALAAGLAAVSPAAAQQAPAQQPAAPTQAEIETAVRHFSLASGVLQAEQVPLEAKNQLFLCMYAAPFSEISEKTSALIAANDQLNADDDNHARQALMFVCGYRPQQPAPQE